MAAKFYIDYFTCKCPTTVLNLCKSISSCNQMSSFMEPEVYPQSLFLIKQVISFAVIMF